MFVYILYSRSKEKYYVGQSAHFEARYTRHNQGRVPSTKGGRPWDKVYVKTVPSRPEAVALERKIKGRGAKRYLEDIGM